MEQVDMSGPPKLLRQKQIRLHKGSKKSTLREELTIFRLDHVTIFSGFNIFFLVFLRSYVCECVCVCVGLGKNYLAHL